MNIEKPEGSPTGRLTESQPNMQPIPIRTKEGALLRRAFINHLNARTGHET